MPGRLVHIPAWWVIVGVMTTVLTPILTIYASVQINQRTIEQNEQAKVQARHEATARYCRLIGSQLDVYSEARTEVGKKAHQVWLSEYQLQGCTPPR